MDDSDREISSTEASPESPTLRAGMLVTNIGGAANLPLWQGAFAEVLPGMEVRAWDDPQIDPTQVRYALVWAPTPGRLAEYCNLELILSSASGVGHIVADPAWPQHVPIVRMVTPETAERMADYVTMAALALIRNLPQLIAGQREAHWQGHMTGRMASDTRVGVLGMGQLGTYVSERLRACGFQVAGWSRSPKQHLGIECFAGPATLLQMLSRSDVVVNLLPSTPQTRGILSSAALSALPRGAGLINVGRGEHLDKVALLTALESGQLSGAMLDVFDLEPLPASDPLWSHPSVIVTPHIASTPSPRARARQAAQNILAHERGELIEHLFDPLRGY